MITLLSSEAGAVEVVIVGAVAGGGEMIRDLDGPGAGGCDSSSRLSAEMGSSSISVRSDTVDVVVVVWDCGGGCGSTAESGNSSNSSVVEPAGVVVVDSSAHGMGMGPTCEGGSS
ncbi:MAG: hypothetical protein QGG40_13745, partial [Myxococcota bacterium]|nr:hypothetical protein [Myxococcota bacterium]